MSAFTDFLRITASSDRGEGLLCWSRCARWSGARDAVFVLRRYSDGQSIEFRSETESSNCCWIDGFASSSAGDYFDSCHICLDKAVLI